VFQPDIRVVELLIAHGFDLNAVGPRNGYTPLHDAVWADNVAAARVLLTHGARTDIRGKDGLTPYDKAVRERKQAMAELLKNAQR
jgi:ankyrin repeat protein